MPAHKGPFRHVQPPALRPGDAIGVIAPSGTPLEAYPKRAARGIAVLQALGYEVRVLPHSKHGLAGGRQGAKARADDLNLALRDPEIRLVLSAAGGWCSNAILPFVDYAALADDPKIVQGHSDMTALLHGLHVKSGVVTIHGPQLIPHFGRPHGPNPDTLAWWQELVTRPRDHLDVPHPRRREETVVWESRQDRAQRRASHANPIGRVVHPARVAGELLGGNLTTLQVLAGTPYWPNFEGVILFWEEVRESYKQVARALTHLREAGALGHLAAMLVGKPVECTGEPGQSFEQVVLEAVEDLSFPVVFDVDFGHGEPFIGLPVGTRAGLRRDGTLQLLEPVVR